MRVTVKIPGLNPYVYSDIGAYVRDRLDGSRRCDGGGIIESAVASTQDTSEALGHLIEILIEKEVLGVAELCQIVGEYRSAEVQLTD